VLDFHRGSQPRNFLSRREQWRLLLLVLTLGLVAVLTLEARDPEHYRWLLAEGPGDEDPSAGDRPVDTLVRAEPVVEDIPGTFRLAGPVAAEAEGSSRYFPGVRPSHLKSIGDNKPLGFSEWDAWLHLFDVLENSSEAALQRASTGRAGFVQLFEQSSEYRGELVTVEGIIRRAHPAKTPKNDYGLEDYYQTWLWPDDHPNDPIVVWCLHLPDGFPVGMEMAEEAEATGFFFKRWAYKAADGNMRRAPMVLARTVHWRKRSEATSRVPEGPLPLVLMIAGAAAFGVLAAVYVYNRPRRRGPTRAASPEALSALGKVETTPDMDAVLRQSADSEEPQGP
jgi:hypothetical protein